MNTKKYIIRMLMALTIILSTAVVSKADPDPFSDPSSNDAPIDGGLSLLVAAGVGYGAKKVKDARKKKLGL